MRLRRRRVGVALGILVLVSAGFLVAESASAEPEKADRVWILQQPIDDANDAVELLLEEEPNWRSFHGGSRANVEEGRLDVFLTEGHPTTS